MKYIGVLEYHVTWTFFTKMKRSLEETKIAVKSKFNQMSERFRELRKEEIMKELAELKKLLLESQKKDHPISEVLLKGDWLATVDGHMPNELCEYEDEGGVTKYFDWLEIIECNLKHVVRVTFQGDEIDEIDIENAADDILKNGSSLLDYKFSPSEEETTRIHFIGDDWENNIRIDEENIQPTIFDDIFPYTDAEFIIPVKLVRLKKNVLN